ncbi:MAG TPA: Fur family transcriptional regulator [Microbacteriaceae bacterium]|nr:Fur family transcriptional regulator [Microbacteriaceae bacterium]
MTKRSTWQREAVRSALAARAGFVSAQDLHAILATSEQRIGLATVYRALADLAENGLADALTSAAGEVRYRACTSEHHHHLMCRTCGATVEIGADAVEVWARTIAEAHGFDEPSHTVDIYGRCPSCRELA